MRIKQVDLSNIKTVDDLQRKMSEVTRDMLEAVNGRLAFKENVECNLVAVDFTAANTETQVEHGLNRVPVGYILSKTNAAASVYDGSGTNNEKHLFVKSNAVAKVTLLVF